MLDYPTMIILGLDSSRSPGSVVRHIMKMNDTQPYGLSWINLDHKSGTLCSHTALRLMAHRVRIQSFDLIFLKKKSLLFKKISTFFPNLFSVKFLLIVDGVSQFSVEVSQ